MAKVSERFEFEMSNDDGVSIRVAGVKGDKKIEITVNQPARGYGMSETPESRSSINISLDDWNEIASLVRRFTVVDNSYRR